MIRHQPGNLQLGSFLTPSTRGQHHIPQVKCSVLRKPPPTFRCQSKVQVVTAIDWRLHDPLLAFESFAGAAHRIQRNIFHTRWWVYYERTGLRNSQQEEMQREGKVCGKKPGASIRSQVALSLNLQVFTYLEALWTPPVGFLWKPHYIGVIDYITGHWWLNSISSLSPLPRGLGMKLKDPNL